MSIYKQTSEVWNKLASLYEERFMYLDLYNETYDTFCSLISKDHAKILDVACGPGNITRYLLSKRSDFQILGIDIALNMIELAQKNNPEASFSLMDCRDIRKLHTLYDGIVFGFGLPYLLPADGLTFLTDAYDLLTDEGVLYVSFMDGPAEQSGYKTGSNGDQVYFNYYPATDIRQHLIKTGFKNLSTFVVPYQRPDGSTEEHTIMIGVKVN